MRLLARANALHIPLRAQSVHCVVTSPPYWGLRDYGIARWVGGDPECDHDQRRRERDPNSKSATSAGQARDSLAGRNECRKCGARRVDAQLGLEPTPEEYVARMVEVFREVRRVLRDDGTVWLNLGDSYAGSNASQGGDGTTGGLCRDGRAESTRVAGHVRLQERLTAQNTQNKMAPGLKPKDLCGIPWRVAFALQADGWYLRSDIVWSKPNPMPESVTDRPTKAHEYVFLLSKRAKYFYDNEAVREGSTDTNDCRVAGRATETPMTRIKPNPRFPAGVNNRRYAARNRRTVWTIATQPYSGAHFATFPERLVEPCILAGTSERGVCPECGAGWVRVVETERVRADGEAIEGGWHNPEKPSAVRGGEGGFNRTATTGWSPACDHGHEPVPATVLDPFAGTATTVRVANRLGRRGVGLDLSGEYLKLASKRTARVQRSFA